MLEVGQVNTTEYKVCPYFLLINFIVSTQLNISYLQLLQLYFTYELVIYVLAYCILSVNLRRSLHVSSSLASSTCFPRQQRQPSMHNSTCARRRRRHFGDKQSSHYQTSARRVLNTSLASPTSSHSCYSRKMHPKLQSCTQVIIETHLLFRSSPPLPFFHA